MKKILLKKESKIKTIILLFAAIALEIYAFWHIIFFVLEKQGQNILFQILIYGFLIIVFLATVEMFLRAYFAKEYIYILDKGLKFKTESKIPFLKKERFLPFDSIEKVVIEKRIVPSQRKNQTIEQKNNLMKIKKFVAEDLCYFRITPKKGTDAEKVKTYGMTLKVSFYTHQITLEEAEIIKRNLKDKISFG